MGIAQRVSLSLIVYSAISATGCSDDPDEEFVRATATIEDRLPVDGCSFPVTIDEVRYAPDEASLDLVHELLGAQGAVTVEIRYRVTGRTGHVTCERNQVELPEIAILLP